MEDFKTAVKNNEEVQKKIEALPFDLPNYDSEQQRISSQFLPLPKVTLFTKIIAVFEKPMMKLLLYFVFILLSGWLTKRFINKSTSSPEEEEEEEEEERRPSKKERKILKKYNREYTR